MRRYEEELDLLSTFAGKTSTRRPFLAIENTLLNDFVERLASGDVSGARSLARFGAERVPQFPGSFREHLMRGALALGPGGGRLLRVARRLYLSRSLRSHAENAA